MLAGKPPFRGQSGLDTLHAILKEPAPPLPSLGEEVSTEIVADFQNVLDKCLAKEPEQRYETMKEAVGDLGTARRRLESGAVPPATATKPRRAWMFAGAGALAAILVAAAVTFFSQSPSRPVAPLSDSKPSIAVFYFENNTGDPSLDWLRTALTDMLITDLSQSTQVEVLSTDRLYQIFKEMNRLDERITSFEMVQEVAERANVNTVLLGSFIKAGDNIRISTRLQEAASGKILSTEKVEGVGEDSIFPMVDDLTRRIKRNFESAAAADAELDLDLKDVATSSVEANLEAIPAFERAIELDPEFAMALAKLAVVHSNAGHDTASERYSQRAVELADRLTPRERYYIEGWHYGQKDETTAKSLEAYEKALELYPNHAAARTNLASGYAWAERFEESIKHRDTLRQSGDMFPGTYTGLASAYDALGQQESANQALQDFLSRSPDSASGYSGLGHHLTRWGKFVEALEAFGKARALGPGNFGAHIGPWRVFVLREDWKEARRVALELESSVPRTSK
jgi:tetratricopeptide (TPR) repeat protein